MLRIFRPTSPMSIGSWTLTEFWTLSGLVAVGQLVTDLSGLAFARQVTRLLALPAALSGALMACYTGVLLSATSVPLWSTAALRLPALFGATAMATATAALSLYLDWLRAPRSTKRRLGLVSLIASVTQLAVALLNSRRWKQRSVARPIEEQPIAMIRRAGVFGLGISFPLVVHLVQTMSGRRSSQLSVAVALATLIGGFTERAAMVFAGNASARRPEDYFAVTQMEHARAGNGTAHLMATPGGER
jgi:formate-dependent nitrite reductase membrane component NrfD